MEIVIYGGGGLALEVLTYIEACNNAGADFVVKHIYVPEGFDARIDDAKAIFPEISLVQKYSEIAPKTLFVIGIGDPIVRYKVRKEVIENGFGFTNIIHPLGIVAPTAKIGTGVIIAPCAFVGPFATIGDGALLNTYASVGHDATIGDCVVLSPYSCLNGNAVAGDYCFFGSYSCLSPKAKIGTGCKLSAGTIFSRVAEAGSMIAGNPAKSRVMFKTIS